MTKNSHLFVFLSQNTSTVCSETPGLRLEGFLFFRPGLFFSFLVDFTMSTICVMFVSCALLRPRPVLHLRCRPARRFCKWSWNTSTQTSLPPLKVMSFSARSRNRRSGKCFILCLRVPTESLNVEFICNVLVVADQLLITRLKEMCEVAITENCMLLFSPLLYVIYCYQLTNET